MPLLKTARAWVRATPAWSEDDQIRAVRAWCAGRGLAVTVYRESEIGRDAWVRALRSTEAAVLPRLDLIVLRKLPDKRRPSTDLTVTLATVRERAAIVVDVNADATTENVDKWAAALESALRKIASGRRKKVLDGKAARKMAKASGRVRGATSPVNRWTDDNPEARARLAHYSAIWKSRKFNDWKQAREALPDDLRSLSQSSLRRIFGGRT